MNSELIYKCVSDLINESYDWFSDESISGNEKIQYVLGLNDMARHLAERLCGTKEQQGCEHVD